jgi:hypothetical protein
LKQANEISKSSELFSTTGTAREGGESDPFLAQVEKTRMEMFKDKPRAEGFALAYNKVGDEHPELAREYVNRNTHHD